MNSSISIAGRIGGAVFGLVFAGFGLMFIGLVTASFLKDSDWPLVECRAVSSTVVPADGEEGGFNAVVKFRASDSSGQVDGTHKEHKDHFDEARTVADAFWPGSVVNGRRNPANRSEVVFDSSVKTGPAQMLILPFMLIPLAFVVIGFGIAWKSIRSGKAGPQETSSISARANDRSGRALGSFALIFMGGIFTLIGGRFSVRWKFNGAVHRLSRVRVHLVGRESAIYSRGTSTTTDRSVFLRMPIAEVTDHATLRDGAADIVLPNDTAPSFEAKHNKLEWLLVVEGENARWPDIDEEFPVTIVPPETSAGLFESETPGPELVEDSGFRLGVRGGRHAFRPGESIDGVAAWSLESAPRSAEVRLFWFTEGKGTTDIGVIRTETFSAMQSQDARPFRFDLPQGPLSIDGRLVSVNWAIEFVAVSGSETVLRWDLVVSPTGRPLTLQTVTVDPKRKKSSFRFARS